MKEFMQTFPRRSQLSLHVPSEVAITKAIEEVEKMGSDENLTNAIVKLQEAMGLVSDFVDNNS